MDESLEQAIRKALEEAQAAGADYITLTGLGVRAAIEVDPELTASDALAWVKLVRDKRG
jgi:hypothetical protein